MIASKCLFFSKRNIIKLAKINKNGWLQEMGRNRLRVMRIRIEYTHIKF